MTFMTKVTLAIMAITYLSIILNATSPPPRPTKRPEMIKIG